MPAAYRRGVRNPEYVPRPLEVSHLTSNAETPSQFAYLPMSIRLETLGGIATPFVLRGTPLPAERVETFSTAEDGQTAINITLLLGERPLAAKTVKVGSITLTGLPPLPAGTAQVRVALTIDRELTIVARASVAGTELQSSGELRPSAKYLRRSMIAKILADASVHQAEDDQKVGLVEATNRATSLVREAEERLASERKKASSFLDLTSLGQAIAKVGLALESQESDQIREATLSLESRLRQSDADLSGFFGSSAFTPFFGVQARAAQRPATPAPGSAKKKPRPVDSPKGPSEPHRQAEATKQPLLGRVFGGGAYTLDPNLCFVLMPFDRSFLPIYEEQVKPTVVASGLSCQRADEIHSVNVITVDIWEKINRSRFLIADLTHRNPNVFYEVGLAHALGKDVILLTQSIADVPFDLRSIRCLVYEMSPEGLAALSESLRLTIAALMKTQ